MSFLFGGKPQLSSAEKIAAAETEVEMISDMFNRYGYEAENWSHG
jgi:import inner membrane translocase subunit TIM10